MGVYDGSPRQGLENSPGTPSGNDAYDKMTGKGIYYTPPTTTPPSQSTPPPPPRPTPIAPSAPPRPPANYIAVKQPEASLVQYIPESLGQEVLQDLYYEDIGGVELISISRHDTINGQPVIYSLIKNLSVFNRTFDPNNILAGQPASTRVLEQYAIDITSALSGVSLDANGNLVIEFSSVGTDDYLEAVVSSDGTIYRIAI
jgi:hypothetical protein